MQRRRLWITSTEAAVDLAVTLMLLGIGCGFVTAQLSGFAAGALAARAGSFRMPRFLGMLLLIGVARGLLLGVLVDRVGLPVAAAALVGAVLSAISVEIGSSCTGLPARPKQAGSWRRTAVALITCSVLLRLFVAAGMDLLPEEAYYWNYGEHLDTGYLDHPPLIGWAIRAFTEILGHHELAVRAPALLFWGLGGFFLYRLARNLVDRDAALRSTVLYASLPVFFSVGLLSTPDAPMFACWAGALHFLERSLVGGRSAAWLGAGLCLGIGLLSKYTIALLVPSAVVFCLLDREARRWLARPEPYFALLLAAAIFSPVITWNVRNDWASFAFQSSRRLAASSQFSLHLLLGSVAVLLTPIGLLAALPALCSKPDAGASREHRFSLVFTLLPFSAFVLFSLSHAPKLLWAGPIWIALLPFMASQMRGGARWMASFLRRAWPATVVVSLLLLCGGAYYISLGLPGAPTLRWMVVPAAWRELGEQVDEIAEDVRRETGEEPVRAGVDHYFLSSESSFYTAKRGASLTAGRHLTGRDSLMWERWMPWERVVGRTVILLGRSRRELTKPHFPELFERLTEVRTAPIRRHGRTVVLLFWRVGYEYRGPAR